MKEIDVNKAMLAKLNESERQLVLETEKSEMAKLDMDGLLALQERVRRARNKASGQYRRRGASQVSEKGGRGKASQQNQGFRDKTEVLEEALARVSAAVAKAARKNASDLKAERLAAARGEAKPAAAATPTRSARKAASTPATKRTRSNINASRKKNASTLAQGARRQAKRDSR